MSANKYYLTRKIQLRINHPDPVEKQQLYDKLYNWQYNTFRSANYIFTHQFLQDNIASLFYFKEGVKLKLASMLKDGEGVLTTSRLNTTYQVLAHYFKNKLPSDIYTGLNNRLVNDYNRERQQYINGQKSMPNYRQDIPMPVKGRNLRSMYWDEDVKNLHFVLFGIPFCTVLGRGYDDKRGLLQRMTDARSKLCNSALQLKDRKIYLLATFEAEADKPVGSNIIAEVNLSMDYPLQVKIEKHVYNIGNKEEFLHRRLAIQAAIKRAQAAVGYASGGHGKKKKFSLVTKYKDAEKNYIVHKLHLYSRRLIDLCKKHAVGTILLLNHTDKQASLKERENSFLLRNWNMSGLRDKIIYKARLAGMEVIDE